MDEVPAEERVIARAVAEGRTDEAVAAVRAQAAAMLGQVVGLPGDDLLRTFEQLIPPNEANPDPDFRRWMAADLEEALRVGVDGFVGDNVSWGYTWDIDPSEVAPADAAALRQRRRDGATRPRGVVAPAHPSRRAGGRGRRGARRHVVRALGRGVRVAQNMIVEKQPISVKPAFS